MVVSTAMIRPIETRDNDGISAVIRAVMPEFGACGPGFSITDSEVSAMAEAYTKPRASYFILEIEGRVCGGAGIAELEGADDPTVAELKKMYFLDHARGLGFGQTILAMCFASARAHGYRLVYLETLAHMAQARKLYERAGFVRRNVPAGNTGHSGCDTWYELKL